MNSRVIILLAVLSIAAVLAAACGSNWGDSSSSSSSNTQIIDDDDEASCADYTNATDCEFAEGCEWAFPDESTDDAASRLAPGAATGEDEGDGGVCREETSDEGAIVDCDGLCDDMIGCGYSEEATACSEACGDGSLDLLGAQVAADADVLGSFADCVAAAADSCSDPYELWSCAVDACCVDQATANDLCGLEFEADCSE